MSKTTLLDLYRGPLSVWVEDQLTHDVLTQLWADTQINVLVTGGTKGVQNMIRSLPARAKRRVYGVIDRDFDEDDQTKWLHQDREILRIPAHELENLLLDFEVLSALSGVESAAQIEQRAKAHAEKLLFFMATKAVLRQMQADLGSEFPTDPSPTLGSLESAAEYLDQVPYWQRHDSEWNRWRTPAQRKAALDSQAQRLRADLQTQSWLQTFSGKELFRHLRGAVSRLDTTPVRPPDPSQTDRDENLAKRIAAKMVELNRIPEAITKLRQVLRTKAGLPPA